MDLGLWRRHVLSVTALTALVAHMEHGPRAWDHRRALPVARWKLYAAKAISVIVVVAAISLLNLLLSLGAILSASSVSPCACAIPLGDRKPSWPMTSIMS